jgi:hypothetical protein
MQMRSEESQKPYGEIKFFIFLDFFHDEIDELQSKGIHPVVQFSFASEESENRMPRNYSMMKQT